MKKAISGSGIEKNTDPDPVCPKRLDPDLVCPERLDLDPVNIRPDPQPWFGARKLLKDEGRSYLSSGCSPS